MACWILLQSGTVTPPSFISAPLSDESTDVITVIPPRSTCTLLAAKAVGGPAVTIPCLISATLQTGSPSKSLKYFKDPSVLFWWPRPLKAMLRSPRVHLCPLDDQILLRELSRILMCPPGGRSSLGHFYSFSLVRFCPVS